LVLRRRVRPLAALLALLLLTAACAAKADDELLSGDTTQTDGGGDTTPDSTEGDEGAQPSDTLQWEECSLGECAELDVPVDYDDPDGPTLTLSVARAPAQGERIGALFVNPGGPGGTASDFASQLGFLLPDDIIDHFDIVGVDPRGLGSSDIDCGGDPDPVELYGVDYTIDSPEDTAALLDVSQAYIDACEAAAGDVLPFLGTENVARDIDAVRAAMGDEQLSYLGYSYGTAIGQMLAQLFPDRIRAMVIDGVLELGPTGTELAADQAAGFETALQSYAAACNEDDDCPLAPDAVGAIEQLQAQVEQAPIPAAPRDLGPGELSTGLAYPLYDPMLWGDLSEAVANALDGDGSDMVSLADQYLDLADTDIYFAVGCLDNDWPETPDELLAAGKAAAADSPHFGEPIVNDYVRCAMWPAEEEPLPAVTAPGTPPILVVSTRNDPATPYEAGVRTAERLESGVLLTYEGDGHTIVGQGSDCVDDAVARYLVDLEPPDDGTTCE
jgi:pimeloyl-ACP methyl ester carboxylesterase